MLVAVYVIFNIISVQSPSRSFEKDHSRINYEGNVLDEVEFVVKSFKSDS